MRIKLTNILQTPFTHPELSEQVVSEGPEGQPLYDRKYVEYVTGDVIELSEDAAENLIRSGQAVQLDAKDQELLDDRGIAVFEKTEKG